MTRQALANPPAAATARRPPFIKQPLFQELEGGRLLPPFPGRGFARASRFKASKSLARVRRRWSSCVRGRNFACFGTETGSGFAWVFVSVMLVALVQSAAGREGALAQPMKDFVYPLEFHENGQVKIRLAAQTVEMPREGSDRLDARGVVLELFDEQGHSRGRMEAEDCIVDRKRRIAYSRKGAIRVERGGLLLTGRGFRFHMDEQRLEILKDARVEAAVQPGGKEALTLPSQREPASLEKKQ